MDDWEGGEGRITREEYREALARLKERWGCNPFELLGFAGEPLLAPRGWADDDDELFRRACRGER